MRFIRYRLLEYNMPRLYASGTVGSTNGMKWINNAPAGGDIDADNDNVMSPVPVALIDLSDLSSQILGQQVSQTAAYTIRRINISLRNVDDAIDNDEGAYFKGTLRSHYPTEHKQKALQLAREAEKFAEAKQVDADSFFLSTANDYSGIRFGWQEDSDGAVESEQVRFQTEEDFGGVPGSQWSLQGIFDIYNTMHPNTKTNGLWLGRAGSMTQKVTWAAGVVNHGGDVDRVVSVTDWNSGNISMKALCGLLSLTVSDSSGDEAGSVDDDYQIVVSIEYDVGVDA